MNNLCLTKIVRLFQALKNREHGQDMVEYSMLIALICFGATAGMSTVATGVNTAFGNVSTTLATNITSILF